MVWGKAGRMTAMHLRWTSVAIVPAALMALTLTFGGVPRAAVADAPPACIVEWTLLGGCPTSDAAVAAHPVPVSPVVVTAPGL